MSALSKNAALTMRGDLHLFSCKKPKGDRSAGPARLWHGRGRQPLPAPLVHQLLRPFLASAEEPMGPVTLVEVF